MILVMIGGGFGAMSRYLLSQWLSKWAAFPLPTLLINLIGSFLLGMVLQASVTDSLYLLCAIGFLGAFTTFSTFSYEALTLLMAKQYVRGLSYVTGSVFLCLIGGWLGLHV